MSIHELIFGTWSNPVSLGLAALSLRIFMGALFIVHGIPKLRGESRRTMRESMAQLGIPKPLFDLVGLLEVLGGIALLLGLLTRLAAILFAIFMIGNIIFYVTKLYKVPIPRGYMEPAFKATRGYMFGWELDSILLASSIAIALTGPGPFSIDYLILTLT